VTKSLKTLAESVGRKRCYSIARHVLKNVKTRKKVFDILQKDLQTDLQEMREMCRKKNMSSLRQSSPKIFKTSRGTQLILSCKSEPSILPPNEILH